MSLTVPQIFEQLPSYFVKGSVQKETSIYFSIGDDASGKWTVLLGPDKVDVKPGKAVAEADLVLKTSADLFTKMILKGYTPGPMDFMRGKIKSNDPTGLIVLQQAFRLPK